MPISFGIPLGLMVVVVGVFLFFATKYKTAAKVVVGFGAFIAVFTFLLILLAIASQM